MVPCPPLSILVIGPRWVYAIKVRTDGSLEQFEARVVEHGFSQEYGIDFEETFAPVAKMVTVRTLFTTTKRLLATIFRTLATVAPVARTYNDDQPNVTDPAIYKIFCDAFGLTVDNI
ncbi:unnamed protein product [Linum trigynum]|uniref:Reverse transcriptase Ty1/copia-type domain-containing protein n=1 Tax=Linum trigynum TaxID=586398 RepID=A0AAV2D731_9ROSI